MNRYILNYRINKFLKSLNKYNFKRYNNSENQLIFENNYNIILYKFTKIKYYQITMLTHYFKINDIEIVIENDIHLEFSFDFLVDYTYKMNNLKKIDLNKIFEIIINELNNKSFRKEKINKLLNKL